MNIRIVLGLHALVLLLSGALWFVPGPADSVFTIYGWHRTALLALATLAPAAHLALLRNRNRAVSPSLLILPLLLPAFGGLALGIIRIRPLGEALASDPNNPALDAAALWFGGAEVALALGTGLWISGTLLLVAAVGAAGILVARGGFEVHRTLQQRLAIGLAAVVASALVRFAGGRELLPSDALAWGAVLASVSLILLVGGRARRFLDRGWQSTLLHTCGLALPLGVLFTVGGWRAMQIGLVITSVGQTGAFDRLAVFHEHAQAADLAVSILAVAAAAIVGWSCATSSPMVSRRWRLALVGALLALGGSLLSLVTMQSARAESAQPRAHRMLGGKLSLPTVARGYDVWVPELPVVLLSGETPSQLLRGRNLEETVELSPAAMADIEPSFPPPVIPPRDPGNQEGGCTVGQELPGLRLPGAILVVDGSVPLRRLVGEVGTLSDQQPRLYAALSIRPGSGGTRSLPPPWRAVAQLACTGSTLLRIETTVHRALRGLPGNQPVRYIARPEGDGLRVLLHTGRDDRFDELINQGDGPLGPCYFSPGCNAVPCEVVIGIPESWTFDRIMRLVSIVDATQRAGMMAAYRGHQVITLTPDIRGVESVMQDVRIRLNPKDKR